MTNTLLLEDIWQSFIVESQKSYFTPTLNLLNIILIFATALVAYLSWRTAKKANEIQLLPLLALYFRSGSPSGGSIKDTQIILRNISSTPAYDIKIDPYIQILTDIQNVWRLEMKVPATNVIIPGEKKILKVKATNNGKKSSIGEFIIFHLDPRQDHPRKNTDLFITFKNLQGKEFYSKITTGMGGLFIAPAKLLNLIGEIRLSLSSFQSKVLMAYYQLIWKFKKPYFAQPKKK